jgi:hypothetical protein
MKPTCRSFRGVDVVDDDPELLINGFKIKRFWVNLHTLHTFFE